MNKFKTSAEMLAHIVMLLRNNKHILVSLDHRYGIHETEVLVAPIFVNGDLRVLIDLFDDDVKIKDVCYRGNIAELLDYKYISFTPSSYNEDQLVAATTVTRVQKYGLPPKRA